MEYTLLDQILVENKYSGQKDVDRFKNTYDAFTNRGMIVNRDKGTWNQVALKDLVTSEDLKRFVPQVVELVVREAIEPNLFIVDRLFQKIMIETGSRVQIGAIGALEAGRVGQGGEYPERMIDLDSGDMVALSPEKYGLKISLTEEVLEQNQFDVVNIWLRAAGRALARAKERNAAKLLNEMGYRVLDNVNPSTSYLGVTKGRDITGAANGSMTVNDVWELYAYLLNRGFTPDALLLHPMAWKIFMTDTEMRETVLAQSTISGIRQPNNFSSAGWPTSHGGLGLRHNGTGREQLTGNNPKGPSAWTKTLNPWGASFNISPSYLPTPLEVLISIYLPFEYGDFGNERLDAGATSSVMMVDSSACGVIGQASMVKTDNWKEPERDIEHIKLKESYGFGIMEQGKGIAKASNINLARHYNFTNQNSQTLSEINLSGAISGISNIE